MIRLREIEKYYSTGFVKTFVLRNIDLEIEEGEFVSIMGPSGAGKSTLLHILGMLDEPSNGAYYFFDEPTHKLNERKRTDLHKHHIGFVFQSYHLIDELTVYENLETPLLYKKVRGSERRGTGLRYAGPVQYCGEERPVSESAFRRGAAARGSCQGGDHESEADLGR